MAEANYKGFYDYEIPINYNDAPIIERYFDPQHQPAGMSVCDGSMIVPWAVDILSSSETINRAESIAIARHKLRQESCVKSQENDEALREKQSKAIAKVLSQLLLK